MPTRAALAALLAERGAREALPALVRAATETPAMLDAVLAARARLGAPATSAELAALLASTTRASGPRRCARWPRRPIRPS